MRSKLAIPVIAGVAGIVGMMVLAFAVTTQPRQGSDLSLTVARDPFNGTVVGIAQNTTGLISQAEALVIAMRETGLIEETERIEQVYTDWYFVNEDGQVYRVNPQTMEMISTEGDMSRIVEKLAGFETGHYWAIGLETGRDSGYLLIIDASTGGVKDKSILHEV